MPTALGLKKDIKPMGSLAAAAQNAKGSSNKQMGDPPRLNTISKRNYHAAVEVETLLWRALCDSPDAAKEYLAEDCVMINPLFEPSGSDAPMGKDTNPSIEKLLNEGAGAWNSYKMHGQPSVVEVDLMAVAVLYKVSLFRHSKKGRVEEVEATVSSVWRQNAGADWLLCAQHVAYAD